MSELAKCRPLAKWLLRIDRVATAVSDFGRMRIHPMRYGWELQAAEYVISENVPEIFLGAES
jgi:hypothetical protein